MQESGILAAMSGGFWCAVLGHRLETGYPIEGSCDRAEWCTRCPYRRSLGPLHLKYEYRFLTPGSCKRSAVCQRCRKVFGPSQRTKEVHDWQKPVYLEADKCSVRKSCNRCGAIETDTAHKWVTLTDDACYERKRCSRCNAEESGYNHNFIDKDWEVQCLKCGLTQENYHGWLGSDVNNRR